jgi:hypothetical protein
MTLMISIGKLYPEQYYIPAGIWLQLHRIAWWNEFFSHTLQRNQSMQKDWSIL